MSLRLPIILKVLGVNFVKCIDMKTINKILLITIIFFSCSSNKDLSQNEILKKEQAFKIVDVSIQAIYPGVNNGENRFWKNWIIRLEGSMQKSGSAKLLLNNYIIPLGDFGSKGIVIGSDNSNYKIEKKISFPLDLNYSKSDLEERKDTVLTLYIGDEEYQLLIDKVKMLNPIFYPSTNN